MLWLVFGIMLLAAASIVLWPLYRKDYRLPGGYLVAMILVIASASVLYVRIGSPGAQSSSGELPGVDEMVQSLADRLAENPDDLAGWKMLGRSYLQLRRFPEAVQAFERAVEMESARDGQTLADLGEAILMNDGNSLGGRAGQLFESAIAVSPNNQKALFYAGMAAIDRGDPGLAADRWETLLATSPPAEIQDILRQRIAELRGEPPPAPPAPAAATGAGPVVAVNVQLGETAAASVRPDATVFVIARDPAQPSPPIAAVRRKVSELPVIVPLSDSDAMIPGRVPSAFPQLEIVARVSVSGQPVAQPGDWFGSEVIATAENRESSIVIDQQVR